MQGIRAGVAVQRIVRGRAVPVQVDAHVGVAKDSVLAELVAATRRTLNRNANRTCGDRIAGADATNLIKQTAADVHAHINVTDRRGIACISTDQIALNNVLIGVIA